MFMLDPLEDGDQLSVWLLMPRFCTVRNCTALQILQPRFAQPAQSALAWTWQHMQPACICVFPAVRTAGFMDTGRKFCEDRAPLLYCSCYAVTLLFCSLKRVLAAAASALKLQSRSGKRQLF